MIIYFVVDFDMKRTAVAFSLLLFATPPQAAFFLDSAGLKEMLTDFDAYQDNREIRYMAKASQYVGYVTGVVDALDGSRFCLSKGVTAEQAAGIAAKYVQDHPEGLSRHASETITTALAGNYPCPSLK
jgi:hypothetical protein